MFLLRINTLSISSISTILFDIFKKINADVPFRMQLMLVIPYLSYGNSFSCILLVGFGFRCLLYGFLAYLICIFPLIGDALWFINHFFNSSPLLTEKVISLWFKWFFHLSLIDISLVAMDRMMMRIWCTCIMLICTSW